MEIQLCTSEHVSCDAGVFPHTLVVTHVPSQQAQQTSFGTGQRQLIFKVQSKDHCFPGEWKAHGLTSAGLYRVTLLKKQKHKCYMHSTPFSTGYLNPTTPPPTVEKILPPSIRIFLYICSELLQICVSSCIGSLKTVPDFCPAAGNLFLLFNTNSDMLE